MSKANTATVAVVPETNEQKVVTQGVIDARSNYGKGQTKLAIELLLMHAGLPDLSIWVGSGKGQAGTRGFMQINGKMKTAIAGGKISVSLVASTWSAALKCEALVGGDNPIVVLNSDQETIEVNVARLKNKARSESFVISFHTDPPGKGNGKTTRASRIKTMRTNVRDLLDKIKPEATKKTPNSKNLTVAERKDLLWMQERIALAIGNKVVTSAD
jgi:hypothetical protein